MKILHTGDLHLGKVFHEIPLLEDQKLILSQILDELGKDDYAALVIAGDIYDRSVPPAEAVEAFSSFLAETRREFPDTAVFIIPGNHDSPARLSYVSEILREQKVYITCNPQNAFTPLIITHRDENVAFFSLPFLFPGTLENSEDGSSLLSQAALAEEAAARLASARKNCVPGGVPSVLIAHLFATGGETSSSERAFVGTAEKVSASLFEGFAYVALGHLHKAQKAAERMYYSGSPLAYAFDEAGTEKCFLKVEIDAKAKDALLSVTPIKVKPARKVTRLRGQFMDFFSSPQYASYIEDYLEIELTDSALQESPLQRLKERFPYILSVKQNILWEIQDADIAAKAGEETDPLESFVCFEKYLYPEQKESELKEKKEIFASALEECRKEEVAG